MTEKNNEIDVFESLAETMMFRAEDGEKMREDILKIRKTITAIAPAEKKEAEDRRCLDSLPAEELREDKSRDGDRTLAEHTNGYNAQYNTVPRVV